MRATAVSGGIPHKKLSERAWMALGEALRTYHWYRNDFETLVRARFSEAPDALAGVSFQGTKREATGQLIVALRSMEPKYQGMVIDALLALADVDSAFPHLARLEDGESKVREAQAAHTAVCDVVEQFSELAAARETVQREAERSRQQAEARRLHDSKLSELKRRFFGMAASDDDPQGRGRDLEPFLNELFQLWDLDPRAAYSLEHEQVDGAFSFRTDDYLLEARWWANALGPKELNDFKAKVDGKARNTLGLCISISGFTEGAIVKHSQPQTPLVLMDGSDLVPVLEGHLGLDEVLLRKRRHAAETGRVMYRVNP